jgi:deoxyribodipyrimidine photolyase
MPYRNGLIWWVRRDLRQQDKRSRMITASFLGKDLLIRGVV